MQPSSIPTLVVLGVMLTFLLPRYGHTDHLTTKPGAQREIFHGEADPAFHQPQPITTGWGTSLRLGGAFRYDDDITEMSSDPLIPWEVSADSAFLLNGQLFYHIDRYLHIGLNLEWEAHKTTVSGVDIEEMDLGTIHTVSLMPYIEVHLPFEQWSPYASLGLGINLNKFNDDDELVDRCTPTGITPCHSSFSNTVAFKVGAGFDYFVTPNWTINAEVAWKLNSGDGKFTDGAAAVTEQDFNLNTFQMLFGLRWYIK